MRNLTTKPLLAAACLLAACSGSGRASDAGNAPFGPPTAETTFTLTGTIPGSTAGGFLGAIVGDKDVGGQTLHRYKLSTGAKTRADLLNPAVGGTEFWLKLDGSGHLLVGGGGDAKTSAVVADTPLDLDAKPAVGVSQTYQKDFQVTLPNQPSPVAATLKTTYKLAAEGVSVDTGMGTVTGCSHYSGTVAVSSTSSVIPSIFLDKDFSVDIWYHPDLGIVSGGLTDLGLTIGLAGLQDCGTATPGEENTIRKTGYVDATHPRFSLDTYDCDGTFDADKMNHAKMLLELRWADDAMAKDPGQASLGNNPAVAFEFGDVVGYFPAQLLGSPVSIFHPEENGKGYKYWYGYVSQADRYLPGSNGISYHVTVTTTGLKSPVRVTARILYGVVTPS